MVHSGGRVKGQENGRPSGGNGEPSAASFCQNRPQHTAAIPKCIQVADTMQSRIFEARYLSNSQPCFGDANMDEGLDFEAIAPKPRVTFPGLEEAVASSPRTGACRRQEPLNP